MTTRENVDAIGLYRHKSGNVKKKISIYLRNFPLATEIWSLDKIDNTVSMKIAEPKLQGYSSFPELFIVDSNFCIKK